MTEARWSFLQYTQIGDGEMKTCPICGIGNPIEKYVDYETQYRGSDGIVRDVVVPDVLVTQCASCHEEFLDSRALAKVEAAQRLAIGRLSSNELRTWRESLRQSQTELSTTLGFGKKTYARWETGAYTLTAAADRYIRLVMAKPENYAYVERLAQKSIGSASVDEADDLANVVFSAPTEDITCFFAADDPVFENLQVFCSEFSQGRVWF